MRTSAAMVLIGFTLLAVPAGQAQTARELLRKGLGSLEANDPEAAAQAFAKAAEQAPAQRLDPAVAQYNRGLALHRIGDPGGAAAAFEEALRTDRAQLQAKSYYNLGSLDLEAARALAGQQQLDPAAKKSESALRNFKNALALDPADEDAKFNFEVARRLQRQIEEMKQSQPQPQSGEGEDDQPQNQDESEQPDQEQQPKDGQQPPPQEGSPEQPDSSQQPQPSEGGEEREQETPSQPESEAPPEQMTREEAEMVLRALQQEEEAYRDQLRLRLGRPEEVERDW